MEVQQTHAPWWNRSLPSNMGLEFKEPMLLGGMGPK